MEKDKYTKYEFGVSDYLQLSLWYIIMGTLIYFLGWILGFLAYVAFYLVATWCLKKFVNLEVMTGGDEIWFTDDKRNMLNIVAYHKYEKIPDIDVFRRTILERTLVYPRLKSKIVKALGKFMFRTITDEEVIAKIDEIMPIVSGIHGEDELAEYMSEQQSTRLPLNNLQWRIYFVPDYSPTESLFVYKVHHSLADGIATILFFNDMTDDPKMENYPNLLIRFSFLQDLAMKLVMPIYLLWLGFKLVIIFGIERNGFKTNENVKQLTSKKNVVLLPDINIKDLKRRARELTTDVTKITINDILMTTLSKTLHDYLRLHTDDKETTWLKFAVPFSLRRPPRF